MQSSFSIRMLVGTFAILVAGSLFALPDHVPGQQSSKPLEDYQDRVASAIAGADELIEIVNEEDAESESEAVAEMRRLIPASEKIDLAGETVETDNSWLAKALDQFRDETETGERIVILESISQRLRGIQKGIDDLNAAAKAERGKDEDKQKLAEILKRPEYQKPEKQGESLFQKWWRMLQEWLAKQFPETMPTPSAGPSFEGLRVFLQVLIFAAVAGLIAFLVWRFVPYFARRRGAKESRSGDRVILGERIGESESAADIFSEAERLAGAGDHRGAIRKGYIALLLELGDRKIVRIARHKTNRDYLRDVRKRDELFNDMSGLTSNFERSWYGLRLAGADEWAEFRDRCRHAISSVRNER